MFLNYSSDKKQTELMETLHFLKARSILSHSGVFCRIPPTLTTLCTCDNAGGVQNLQRKGVVRSAFWEVK